MADRLRSGIVGAGFIGEVHARAVRGAGGVVAAVAGRSAASSVAAAERLGADRAAASAEELVEADDVDVVHVCTPNDLHAPLAERALAAGKHVVCEKPLSTGLDSARRLADRAAATATVAAVPFVYRFYPTVRDARARVRRGDTGPLRLLHGSYLQDWLSHPGELNWRVDPARGGGSRAFGDVGVHWCDVVEFVSGQRVARLQARTLTVPRGGATPRTEDAATVLFETDGGALGSVVVSQVSPGRKNRLWFSLDGADASLQFDQELPDSLWIGGREQNTVVARGAGAAGRYDVVPAGHPQGFLDCFTAFVADVYAAVRARGDGTAAAPDGLPTFADGLRAALITDAVVRSARGGGWVDVPA